MNKKSFAVDGPAYYSAKDAAWILGIEHSKICKAIRTGAVPTVRRRSQLVVPASALRRMLGGAP